MTRLAWILLGLLAVLAVTAVVVNLEPGSEAPGPDDQARQALESLPYLAWVPAEDLDKRGVTHHDPTRAHPGLNFYTSRTSDYAVLLDMEGQVLHKWQGSPPGGDVWQYVEMLTDGDILVISADHMLFKLDRDSTVVWAFKGRAHHDVAVAPSGEVYTLVREPGWHGKGDDQIAFLSEAIVRLGPDGTALDRLSLFDLFAEHVPDEFWANLREWVAEVSEQEEYVTAMKAGLFMNQGTPADVFHGNSIEYLTREIPGFSKPGNLLISLRDLDLIAVVDYQEARVRWSWGPGVISRQHHPSLLPNGEVLIFDNRGGTNGKSRALQIEPLSGKITWQYNGDPPESFYSLLRGAAQRLANGNTLLTEADTGRVFEVTPDGEMVWEFFNPVVNTETRERGAIYRMMRIEPDAAPWRTPTPG